MKTQGAIILLAVFSTGCSLLGIRQEETPKYTVIMAEDNYEIRQYESHIVAKTRVEGEYRDAQTRAFRILAGYIFGDNQKDQKIAMTAPVTQEPSGDQSQKIAMTAPVVQAPTEGGWYMTFMMPSKYKMEDLPKPNDDRVEFEVVPAKTVAAVRYSWWASEERNQRRAKELADWLARQENYQPNSEPMYAGYDPPWTIPFLRRQEMLIELDTSPKK